jgi:hypothetical protein
VQPFAEPASTEPTSDEAATSPAQEQTAALAEERASAHAVPRPREEEPSGPAGEAAIAEAATSETTTAEAATKAAPVIESGPEVSPDPVSLRATRIAPISPLRGSLASLVRQNEKTDADNLERIENDADLRDRIARGMLVPVPASAALTVNANLPQDRRYCRPWTARFLADLARAHETQFHHPLEVSSAVRTVDYQKRLMGVNGNAAPAEGDIVSPHVTGATIDIAKGGLSQREIYWMRNRLLALQNAGKLDAEEEFQQACFHITVYKSYVPARVPHKTRRRVVATPVSGSDSPANSTELATRGE